MSNDNNRLNPHSVLGALRALEAEGFLTYQGFSDNWVIELQHQRRTHRILGYTFDVNSQAAAALATDKVATYELLAHHNQPVVPHWLLTAPLLPAPDDNVLHELLDVHHSLVIKPTNGRRGIDVYRCDDVSSIQQLLTRTDVPSWSASPWIDVQRELRLVVLHGKIELTYEKTDPVMRHGLKMFNLNLGAHAKRLDPTALDTSLHQLAAAAMQAIGLELGAVDVVFDAQGKAQVLEINSGFSIEHFAAAAPENYAEAVAFYERLVRSLFA